MTDPRAAVGRLTKWLSHKGGDFIGSINGDELLRSDLRTILDALASITRERDAIKAEADETNGLLEEMRRQLTIAQDERDAMREVEKAARDLAANIEQDSIGFWFVNSEDPEALCCALLSALNAAALVNGEGE